MVIFGPFSQPLYSGFVVVGGARGRVVAEMVCGVVDSVLQQGDGCQLL